MYHQRFKSIIRKLREKVVMGHNCCWQWSGTTTGFKNRDQYPLMWNGEKVVRAHRLMYEQHHGVTLTPDQVIRHTCDNTLCVNPKHLLLGTHADNVADRVARGRCSKAIGERARVLSSDAVVFIRSMKGLLEGDELSEIFGVTRTYIYAIQSGKAKAWGDI